MEKKMKHPAKSCVRISVLLACLLFLLPLITVTVIRREKAGEQEPEAIEILPPGEVDSAETIRVLADGKVQQMSMSEYLQGVVRAEMPASFEQEALCAQAVAARTYTLYKISTGSNHGAEADVCTDPKCCQAFLSKAAAASNWGSRSKLYEAKIENAVAATDAQTLLYDNAPILAVFHSSSAGRTKSAGEVWSQDLPYLQSVTSPEDGSKIPNYYSRVEFTAEEFKKKFLASHPEADFSGGIDTWIQNLTVTEGTNVNTVTIGGVTVRGPAVRAIFSLRSASFETEVQKGKIVFFVTGYGHGVGMSQYGANAMAKGGKTWREILEHYYTGVSIRSWSRGGAA
ncbi:MAG: stage II sporulation protein D [Oscillibacter sp.]|jgi:stage II sporulation protein D|nr:stage II sporulation protein D [Oscillibacter sp.]